MEEEKVATCSHFTPQLHKKLTTTERKCIPKHWGKVFVQKQMSVIAPRCQFPYVSEVGKILQDMNWQCSSSRNIRYEQWPFSVNSSGKCVTGQDRFEMRDPYKSSSQYPSGELW